MRRNKAIKCRECQSGRFGSSAQQKTASAWQKAISTILLLVLLCTSLAAAGCAASQPSPSSGTTAEQPSSSSTTSEQPPSPNSIVQQSLSSSSAQQSNSSTMNQIAQGRVGVVEGSVYDTFMMQQYPNSEVLHYKGFPDLIVALKAGQIDAAFTITEAFKDLQRQDNSLVELIPNILTMPIGMGFGKDQADLREQFNSFLAQIKSDGTYANWEQRWFTDYSFEMPELQNTGANGQLVVAIASGKGLPFATLRNGSFVGSDIELAERFGAYLQRKVVYSDMEFGSVVAACASGKADMACSTLVITEERAKQVDFSDPYYALESSVIGYVGSGAAAANGANGSAGGSAGGDGANNSAGGSAANVSQPGFFEGLAQSFYNNLIVENRWMMIVDGLKVTALISLLAVLFGSLLGALVCALRVSRHRALCTIAKIYISVVRGVPVLVLLMLLFYVIFAKISVDPVVVAVIAFSMNFAGYAAEMYRSSIQSIAKGQTEAGIAGGFTRAQTFIFIILPQAIKRALPVYTGEVISTIKMTSLVGYIAVQDLTKASDIIRSRTFDAFFPLIMIAIIY